MGHRVKLTPVRVRSHADNLGCDVLHLIGYRAVCECGMRSKVKRSRHDLRTWARAHHHRV